MEQRQHCDAPRSIPATVLIDISSSNVSKRPPNKPSRVCGNVAADQVQDDRNTCCVLWEVEDDCLKYARRGESGNHVFNAGAVARPLAPRRRSRSCSCHGTKAKSTPLAATVENHGRRNHGARGAAIASVARPRSKGSVRDIDDLTTVAMTAADDVL